MLKRLMVYVGIALLLMAGVGTGIGYVISGPRYRGPVSDHFNGNEFFTPGAPTPKGLREVLGWQLNRERTQPWGPFHNDPAGPPPPARVSDAPGIPVAGIPAGHDSVRVTFINHSTVLLQFDGLNVLTDPIYEERVSPFQFIGPKRHRPPGIRFEDLPRIDVLLLSHNHWDHLEIGTVRRLCDRDKPVVICPLGVKALLDGAGCANVTELDWQQSRAVTERTTVYCVPAQHFSGRGLFDRNATLWAGYVIDNVKTGKLYFAGDSGYGPHFRAIGERYGPMRLSLIPIGAYKPRWFMAPVHCAPDEAVRIHQDLRSARSMGIHFGTFPLADDGETEPVADLAQALARQRIPADHFRALKEGASWLVE